MKIVWHTPDSMDGERTFKQHGFISAPRGKFYEEKYQGNKAMCNRGGVIDEDRCHRLNCGWKKLSRSIYKKFLTHEQPNTNQNDRPRI